MARRPALIYLIAFLVLAGAPQLHAANLACLTCHSAPGFRSEGITGKMLHVDQTQITESVHSKLDCVNCHVDLAGQALPHKRNVAPVQCTRCHYSGNTVGAPSGSHIDKFANSVHGRALKEGLPDAPQCKTCHGTHNIKPASDPRSSTYRANIPDTCGKCHLAPGFAEKYKLKSVKGYTNSIHASLQMHKEGYGAAAVCTDCHGVHDIEEPASKKASVNRLHVANTCGKCHPDARDKYMISIHGQAVQRGDTKAPVCTDCHGEHTISSWKASDSPVNSLRVVATCSKCHENKEIQRAYGLPTNRLSSYVSSYHGVANKYGDVTVANCASCHGAHDILPSTDNRSAVNRKNLPRTCGKCHPGASQNFAVGSIHVVPTPRHDKIIFWVRTFYMLFVAAIISSFCGYILLDLRARMIGRLPWRRGGHED